MKHFGKIGLCVLLACATGCNFGTVDNPKEHKYLIYNYIPSKNDYELERAKINTLTNVDAAEGTIAYLRGGGSLATLDTKPTSEAEWKKYLTIENSNTPEIEYTIESDGTVVPFDFDSAMMLTVYHHLERSRDYFDTIDTEGLNLSANTVGQEVGRMPCYYYPTISLLGVPLPLFTDNAAYAYTLDAFLIPPRQVFTDAVPIYANRGVITHEYGHAVFNRLVHNNVRGPLFLQEEWENDITAKRALNELQGLDEGIADIFAALDTKDPDFIAYTIGSQYIDRDMSKARYLEDCLFMAINNSAYPPAESCGGNYGEGVSQPTDSKGVRFDYSATQAYDSHHLGAVVASVFWAMRDQTKGTISDDEWGKIIAKSLRDIQDPEKTFRVAMFFDALYNNIPTGSQGQACLLFKERLPAIQDELQCTL